jgi:hypothetical protein
MTDYRQAAARLRELRATHVYTVETSSAMLDATQALDYAAADRERLEQIREWATAKVNYGTDYERAAIAEQQKWQVRAILGDPHE